MFESPPKMINDQCQRFADLGFAAAKAGLTKTAIDDEPDLQGFASPILRMAWIRGWEGGGGDILKGVVVTEEQRLEARRVEIVAELSRIEDRLSAIRASQRRGESR